jgi:hypothetical protein
MLHCSCCKDDAMHDSIALHMSLGCIVVITAK